MRLKLFLPITLFLFFLFFTQDVLATSWWGVGVKSDEWILKHGGALIRFEIYNRQGDSKEYKAVLTRDGKNIEVEVGKQGLFDDARSNTYKVTFYRGGNGRKTFDGLGKDLGSIKFDVRKGESIKLRFNYKTKKISLETDYVKPEEKKPAVVKVPPKEVPIIATPEENLVSEEDLVESSEMIGTEIEEIAENTNENIQENISEEPEKENTIYAENAACFFGMSESVFCQSSLFLANIKPAEYITPVKNVSEEKKMDEKTKSFMDNLRLRISRVFSHLLPNFNLTRSLK